jgi:hypothetical protein
MPELKNYELKRHGYTTTLQLTAEDADQLGATEIGPAHDVQTTAEDTDATDDTTDGADVQTRAARPVQTRARRPA